MGNDNTFKGKIIKQTVDSNKLNSNKTIRTLTISDLHNYTNSTSRLIRLAEAIKEEEPDIILFAGDLLDDGRFWGGGKTLDKFKMFVQNVSEVAPVCLTMGNHDIRGMNLTNKNIRLDNFKRLENERPGNIFPLFNDKIIVNGMEVVGYVPKLELVEREGARMQIHGLAHDRFIQDYKEEGIKFENRNETLNIYLGHDPHLIGASENGVGLEDFSVCDFFVTGHLHDGYKFLFMPIDKIKRVITGKGLGYLELDKGFTEQDAGLVDKAGNFIIGSKRLRLGPTNLCRGIIYIDNNSEQKFLQMPDGKFYKNNANELNVQIWIPIDEIIAREEILNNNLHFMLISEGIKPGLFSNERFATMNIIDIKGNENKSFRHR